MNISNKYKKSASSVDWMFFHNEEIPHNCEVKSTKDDLYAIYPGRSKCAVLGRIWRGMFICPHKNHRAVRFFRSHANINFERSRQLRLFRFMIHPFSYFRIAWEVLMILAMLFSIFISLWAFSFPFDELKTQAVETLRDIRRVTDILCFANIVINFLTGYVLDCTRQVDLRIMRVAKLYVCGYFFVDLVGAVPASAIIRYLWQLDSNTPELTACAFMMIACRIVGTVPYLINLSKVLKFSHENRVYVLVFFGMLVYFHFTSCFFYFIAVVFDNGLDKSWLAVSGIRTSDGALQTIEMYGVSLMRSLSSTLGLCIRFTPRAIDDQVTSMVYMWVGAILFLVLVGKNLQVMKAKTASKTEYSAMITQVKQYMDSRKLPSQVRGRVLEFYHFRFQGAFYSERMIIQSISRQLRQDYTFHQCRSLVERVSFFGDLPTHVLMRIVAVMQTEFFLHGETVIKLNSTGSAMYFVKSGTVAVYSGSGQEVCHLEDGNHFGEISLVLAHFRRVAQVVTLENCELYRLERDDFNAVMAPYPQYLSKVRRTAMKRLEKTAIMEAGSSKNLANYIKTFLSDSSTSSSSLE